MCRPLTKLSFAAVTIWVRERLRRGDCASRRRPPGRRCPCTWAKRPGGDVELSLSVIEVVKWLAISEPNTATPTAPPIWRVVSFTAEPTPAFARGSEPMIESVHGRQHVGHAEAHEHRHADDVEHAAVGLEGGEQRRTTWRRAASPTVTTILLPNRCTHTFDSGAKIISMTACGQQHRAGLDRRVAEHRLQVLRQQEQRAEQRQEHERDRAARRAEARVLEEVHVEHRVARAQLPDEERRPSTREADDEAGDDLGATPSRASAPR